MTSIDIPANLHPRCACNMSPANSAVKFFPIYLSAEEVSRETLRRIGFGPRTLVALGRGNLYYRLLTQRSSDRCFGEHSRKGNGFGSFPFGISWGYIISALTRELVPSAIERGTFCDASQPLRPEKRNGVLVKLGHFAEHDS
jgi:hypothetical protein